MGIAKQLEILAGNLQAYNSHLRSLSEALEALRFASDQILAAVENDRELLAGLTAQSSDSIEQIEPGSAEEVAMERANGDEPLEMCAPNVASLEIAHTTADAQDPPTEGAVGDTSPALPLPVAAVEANLTAETLSALDSLAAKAVAAAAVHAPKARIVDDEAATPVGGAEPIATADAAASTIHLADARPAALEAASAPAIAAPGEAATGIAAATGGAKVIDLSKRRAAASRKASVHRGAMAIAASLAIMAGAVTCVHGLLQTEIGQRIIELSACDGDMLSANRDCALLAWLLL